MIQSGGYMRYPMLNPITDFLYEIPQGYRKDMRVPARLYGSKELMDGLDEAVISQICNVATLPGIVKHALCMPDAHSGYGFPIGGTAAMDVDNGVISPGGIGFDINCGVRLIRTNLTLEEVEPVLHLLVDSLFRNIPAGVGESGMLSLSPSELDHALVQGSAWAVKKGFGLHDDLSHTEEGGCVDNANPDAVSQRARIRGKDQIGTLGSGNHYLEIQVCKKENIFNPGLASAFGIDRDNQIMIMIHCGSRGFGHQIASDYLQSFLSVMGKKYGMSVPDRELACAPFKSDDGQGYFQAMNCAINFAFLNRQLIMHRVREVFSDILKKSPEKLGMRLIYDVCHNTAKVESHTIEGKTRKLLVHRKGATRAFAPGMYDLPDDYKKTGQPVIIGGSMETGSYLLAGRPECADAFFTTAHGSGRVMSRHEAKRKYNGRDLQRSMEQKGIYIRTASFSGLAEEAGGAYKNIDEVIEATDRCGLSIPVAKLLPVGNIKG